MANINVNTNTKTEFCFVDQISCDIHDLNVDHELSSIDISLVMSLLDDSQLGDDGGEEMLRIMIESLADQDSRSDFSDVDQLEGCSSSLLISPDDHVNFEWIDDEMEMDYYSYHVQSLEGFQDYSQVCYGMELVMEDHEDYCNIHLWQ